jgi:hypothetical protein
MAGNDKFDGTGTVWVHDGPEGDDESDEVPAPPARPAPQPAAAQPAAAARGPQRLSAPPPEPVDSGWGKTGCLLLLFVGGGTGLGMLLLTVLAVAGYFFTMRAG